LRAAGLAAVAWGCAGVPPVASGPSYTWASAEQMSTAELAAQLLPPEEAAVAERHRFIARIWDDGPLQGVIFDSRPEVADDEACLRRSQMVSMTLVKRTPEWPHTGDVPVRFEGIRRFTEYSLSPGCAALPGRVFAGWHSYPLPESEALAILKALAAAQRAAAGPGPLPYRLVCVDHTRGPDSLFECPADPRPVFATLPLHQAFTVERHPFPHNCDSSSRDIGDAVEIGRPDAHGYVWDIRLRSLGTPDAEVAMIRQFSRTRVKC
jgi:hypothetical protein